MGEQGMWKALTNTRESRSSQGYPELDVCSENTWEDPKFRPLDDI